MYLSIKTESLKSVKHLNYRFEISNEQYSLFGPISTVNFLVGANNSGKSSFLRKLLTLHDINFFSSDKTFERINDIRKCITSNYSSFSSNSMVNITDIHGSITKSSLFETPALESYLSLTNHENIILNKTIFEQYVAKIDSLDFHNTQDFNKSTSILLLKLMVGIEVISKQRMYRQFKNNGQLKLQLINEDLISSFLKELEILLQNYLDDSLLYFDPPEKKYIPILRTLSSLWDLNETNQSQTKIANNIFKTTIFQSYFNSETDEDLIICTGLDLYNDILLIRNSQKAIRKGFEDFEIFLSEAFFNGKEVEIIAKQITDEKEKHIYIYLDGIEDDIHRFGDGIQSIILLLYPIFTAEKGAWIFIEEPELNLHPGFQRVFLNTILKHPTLKEKELFYFITTHSNHLLDLTLTEQTAVSIFTFHEKLEEKGKSKIISNVKNSNLDALELLGVNNSSIYLANCSIWVEGHTDTLFIRAFLKSYLEYIGQNEIIKEDIHFSFYEYGGSNVSHYLFGDVDEVEDVERNLIKARFLNNKILLIADKDIGKDKKHEYLISLKNKNFDYFFLSVREIENYLTPEQLRQILPNVNKRLKQINWDKINLEYDKYRNEYLGKYLKEKLREKFPPAMKESSGTLKTYYKTKISLELEKNINWSMMGKDAQSLTLDIYKYIISVNNK